MELARDAIRAMLHTAFMAGIETADQTTVASARRSIRNSWLDTFIGKLGGSPQMPTDDIAVQLDTLRQYVLTAFSTERLAPTTERLAALRKAVEQDAKKVQR